MKILPDLFYKEMFALPKGVKPEINTLVYYVHVGIILAGIYGLMIWYNPGNNFLIWGIYLIISDGIAHTILGLD